jgi:hypothetical protein
MLIGLEMSYRLDPASVDESAVVRALRALLGASGAPTVARSPEAARPSAEPGAA